MEVIFGLRKHKNGTDFISQTKGYERYNRYDVPTEQLGIVTMEISNVLSNYTVIFGTENDIKKGTDSMEKWCLIDQKNDDEYITAYESKEEALKEAEKEWNNLTEHDKKQRNSFLVGLCEMDEEGNIGADIIEIAKEYK